MRNKILPLVVLCGLFSTGWILSQNTADNILLDVGAIAPVVFTVDDDMGNAMTYLNQYDFEVLDNGEPRRVENFSRVKVPYSAVVLLDCSESTRARANLLVSTTARFGDHVRLDDKIVFAAFGTEVQTVIDWNAEKRPFSIPNSPICHGTNFYDALDWAVKKLKGVSGPQGVIVFTDGRDSEVPRKEVNVNGVKIRRVVPPAEDREFQKVLKAAKASGARFYFVAVDTDINPGPDYGGPVADLEQIRARMELLTRETGGRIVYPDMPGDTADLFPKIRQDLGVAYSLAFAPTKSKNSTPRKIEIRVRGEGKFSVHQSRDSYVVN